MKKPVPKKSAVKKASAKKIKAPKAFKPAGKPKEYLAYLNKREMELLKKFNGGTIKLGPRGLPSFADDSASSQGVSRGDTSQGTKGSGSTKTSTGSVSNKSTSSAGNRGPTGPSGEARSSPAGNAGGSPGSTSRNSGNAGAGQGGQGSGPKSPMSGQGTSFKTPSSAASYNKSVVGGGSKSPMGGQGTSFSTPQKAAAYNRGVAPKTPQSPMSNQGTSFRTPEAASYYNKNVVPGTGTGLRGPLGPQGQSKFPGTPMSLKSSGLPRAPGSDVEQRSTIMGPLGLREELENAIGRSNQEYNDFIEGLRRAGAAIDAGALRTPQEISEMVRRDEQRFKDQWAAERNRDLNADRSFRATDPYRQRSEDYETVKAVNSARLPDVRLPSSVPRGGYMASPSYRAGGLVRRTFKNK